MRRQRRSGEETREAILATSERLFRERGFSAVSIADIAAALEMSPANVFKHFKSKVVLGRAIAYRLGRRIAERSSIENPDDPPDKRLTIFLARMARAHLHEKTENQYLFEMIPLVFEQPEKGGRMYRRLLEEKLAALIAEAMEAGIYRSGSPESDAGVIVDMLVSVLHPKMMECCDPATLAQKADLIIDIVDCGLKYRVA